MSAQVLELLLFAGVAFFLISKLISVLGTTNEGEGHGSSKGSFFGEPGGMKDVTQSSPAMQTLQSVQLDDLIVKDNSVRIMQNLSILIEKMPDFDIKKFIRGSKSAFEMILEALEKKDKTSLQSLVDSRFMEELEKSADKYGACNMNALEAKVSDIYMFGQTAFVKILFTGNDAASKMPKLHEEWIFTKNLTQRGPAWFLSNIEVN